MLPAARAQHVPRVHGARSPGASVRWYDGQSPSASPFYHKWNGACNGGFFGIKKQYSGGGKNEKKCLRIARRAVLCAGWQRARGYAGGYGAAGCAWCAGRRNRGGGRAEAGGVALRKRISPRPSIMSITCRSNPSVAQMFFARCPRPTRRYSPVSTISAAISCSAATLRAD